MAVIVNVISRFDDRGVRAAQRSIALVGSKAKALKNIESPLARWGADMVRVGRILDQRGRQLQQFGATMTRSFTLPLAAAGAGAVKLAVDFDSSMAKIGSLVGASRGQVERYKEAVLDMARGLPQAPRELADALYFIASAGVKGKTALEVLKASAQAAAAGLGDTQTVADAVTSALGAYGTKALSAAQATDVLVATVREGKLEPEELAGSIGRVLPIASQMGISFDQVGAAMASMSLTGLNAAEAATALRGALTQILKPSKQTEEALHEVGLSAKEVRESMRERGLLPTLEMLRDRFHGNEEALARVFGNVRGLVGVLSLVGPRADENARIFAKLAKASGDTAEAFERAKREDPAVRFKAAMSSLQVAAIKLGNALLPTVTSLVDDLGRLADAFSGLSDGQRKAILYTAGFLAAVGPVSSVLGSSLRAIGAFARGIGNIGMAIGGVKRGLPLYARAIGGTVRGAGRLGAAVGRGTAAIARQAATCAVATGRLVAHTAAVVASRAAQLAAAAAARVWAAAQWLLNAAMTANPIGLVVAAIAGLVVAFVVAYKRSETFRRVVQAAFNGLKRVGLAVLRALKAAVRFFIDALKRDIALAKAAIHGLARAFEAARDAVRGAIDRIVDTVRSVRERILGALSGAGRWLVEVGRDLMRGLWDGLQSMAGWLRDKLTGFFRKLLPDWVEKALDAHSPSRLFARIGRTIPEGLALGIRDAAFLPQAALAAATAGLAVPSPTAAATSAAGTVAHAPVRVGTSEHVATRHVHVHVHLPGGTALVGEAERVAEVLAPHVARAVDRAERRRLRG